MPGSGCGTTCRKYDSHWPAIFAGSIFLARINCSMSRLFPRVPTMTARFSATGCQWKICGGFPATLFTSSAKSPAARMTPGQSLVSTTMAAGVASQSGKAPGEALVATKSASSDARAADMARSMASNNGHCFGEALRGADWLVDMLKLWRPAWWKPYDIYRMVAAAAWAAAPGGVNPVRSALISFERGSRPTRNHQIRQTSYGAVQQVG